MATQPRELLTVLDAQKLVGSFVYGLCGEDGVIFYVGQTRSPHSRFKSHSDCTSNNARLKRRLRAEKGKLRVCILIANPANLNAAEREQIRFYPNLLNLVGADHWAWSVVGEQKPWSAGPGIVSPSSFGMTKTRADWKPKIKAAIAKMTDAERCNFEIGLYRDFPLAIQRRLDKWLDIVQDKMIDCLERSMA